MSDISSSQMTNEGPCSPVFGTATFSTFTTTALTTMLAGSSGRPQTSSDCTSERTSSDTQTHRDDDGTEIDDDISHADEDDSRTERSSPVDDTLSETSSSFLYPHESRGIYTTEDSSGSITSRNTLHTRSRSERSGGSEPYSTNSGGSNMTGSWSHKSAGELIAMFEGRVASSRSTTPFIPASTRSASPVKSTASSGSQAMPGGLPAPFRRTGPPWASTSEYTYVYSSRPSSPTKSAVSASTSSSWSFSASSAGNYDASRSATAYDHSTRPSSSSSRPTRDRNSSRRGDSNGITQTSSRITPPPLDPAEYGCTGRPIRSGYIWYLNAHRLGAYRWQLAQAYLYPQVIIISWIPPDQGRLVVRLDLLSCLEVRTSPPTPYVDEETGLTEQGGERVTSRFDLIYDDSIERLGAESQEDMLDWFQAIQTVFHGTMTVDEYTEPPTPITSFSASARDAIDTRTHGLDTTISSRSLATPSISPSTATAHMSSQGYNATFTTLTTLSPPYSSAPHSVVTTARTSMPTALSLSRTGSGTDIVFSSLSYRNESDASLLGDSCSYVTPASASRSEAPTPTPRESLSSVDQDSCASPSSAYETADAASPSASESFMSLPDVSSFPDEEDEEEQGEQESEGVLPLDSIDTLEITSSSTPEESPDETSESVGTEPSAEGADEPAEVQVESEPSAATEETAPLSEPKELLQPQYSDQGVGTEPQIQETAPESESVVPVDESDAKVAESAEERIMEDAGIQVSEDIPEPIPEPVTEAPDPAMEAPVIVAEEPVIEQLQPDEDTPPAEPELQEELPAADATPVLVAEAIPCSPSSENQSDALSALSLAMPILPNSDQSVSETELSPSERSITPTAQQAPQIAMSTGDATGTGLHLALDKSPSATATEDVWGVETDASYESSVLNPSPSSCSQFLPSVKAVPDMVVRVAPAPAVSDGSPLASALLAGDSLMTPVRDDPVVLPQEREVQMGLEASSLVSVAMAHVDPVPASLVSSETESMSSSTFGESEAAVALLQMPGTSDRDDASQILPSCHDEPSLSTHESPSLDTNLAFPVLAQIIEPPIVRSLSVQCDSAEDIASLNFSHKLTFEADRVIQQLHVFEQFRSQDKLEVKGILLEILELARQEPKIVERWNDRLDRSVGGSVLMAPSPAPSLPTREAVDRSIGASVAASSPRVSARGVDRSVGGSVMYSPPRSTRQALASPPRPQLYVEPDVVSAKAASTVAPPASEQAQAILLTPPPQRPLSTDSMTEVMSYLSSHYSDDLDLDAQDPVGGLEVEPVSPSWPRSLSDDGSSLSKLTEDAAREPSHISRLTTPAGVREAASSENSTQPDVVVEPASSVSHTRSPVARSVANLSSLGINGEVAPVLSLNPSEADEPAAAEHVQAIRMPVPMRAGEPFDGQLALMLKDSSPPSHFVQMSLASPTQEGGPQPQVSFPEPEVAAPYEPESQQSPSHVSLAPLPDNPVIELVDQVSPPAVATVPENGLSPQPTMSRAVNLVDMTTSPSVLSSDVPSILQENLARLQEDNIRMHNENRRVYEEHRLAQEEMRISLTQMKDLLLGVLSSRPTAAVPSSFPQMHSFPSPMVYAAHVPQPSPASNFAATVPGYPTYQPASYLHPTPTSQPTYVLPQMTASSLSQSPFMHRASSEVVEPVIPPPPTDFVPASTPSSSCSECTPGTEDHIHTRDMQSPYSTASHSVSPCIIAREATVRVVSGEPGSPAQIPLPASIVTIASQLPTPVVRRTATPLATSATPRVTELPEVISTPAESRAAIQDDELLSPAVMESAQITPLSSVVGLGVEGLPSARKVELTPRIAEASPVSSQVTVLSTGPEHDGGSDEAIEQEPLPPASSILFNGSPAEHSPRLSSETSSSPTDPEAQTVVIVPPSFSSAQTSPIAMNASLLSVHTQSDPEELASQVPSATLERELTQYADKGVSSSPKTSSACTSPVTIPSIPQHDASTQVTRSAPNSPWAISTATSPVQSAAMIATHSQTDPDVPASPQTLSASTSPIQLPTTVATPIQHVERALSPIAECSTPIRDHDHMASQTEAIYPEEVQRETADKAMVTQDDVSMLGDKHLKRSSWHDAADQFRLLMESTQSTAHEALEVLRKTQTLLDDVQRTQEVIKDEPKDLNEETPPPDSQEVEALTSLRGDVAALKDCLDETKSSSTSQIAGVLDKLAELQLLYEREAERRASQEAEQAAERERVLTALVSEKEHRITELEANVVKITEDSMALRVEHDEALKQVQADAEDREATHLQKIEEHTSSIATLRAEIDSFQAEIAALREQRTQDEQLHMTLDAEREEAFAEQDRLAAEDALQKEQILAEREACIVALRDTLEKHTLELQQAAERETELSSREASQADKVSQQDEEIESLKGALSTLEQEHAQAQEEWANQKSSLEADYTEKEKLASEREADLQEKIDHLQQELDVATEELQKEIQHRLDEVAQLEAAHAESDKAGADAALERERSFIEKYDTAVKEFKEEVVALRVAYEQAVELQKADALEHREADLAEARERAEKHVGSLTELRDQLVRIEERSEERWTQQFDKHGDVTAQLDKMEENASEGRLKAEEYRTQRDEERADAASKPSVQDVVEERLREFSEQLREHIDTSGNGLRDEVSRQHEEALGALSSAVQEQASTALSTSLEEMARQLDALGDRQYTSLLETMKTTLEQQITLHISYYLGELGKLMDTQHAQQLSELLDTVRVTMKEQVVYNVENYLDDLCRQLVPEIAQLLKEVREKAEEKNHLNRQIDCLRDIRREHEPGGRLFDGESAPANHPGLKEFNKKAWRKQKSKSTDHAAPTTDTDVPPPAFNVPKHPVTSYQMQAPSAFDALKDFDVPKQPVASYPMEPPPSWDSWSDHTLSQPSLASSGQVTLYSHPPPAIMPPMSSPSRLTPQSMQAPY